MTLSGDALYLLAGAALLLAAVLPRLVRTRAFSAPMAFVAAGALIGLLPLPGGSPISPIEQPEVAERLTEVTVIVAIFGVGIALDRRPSLRGWGATWRLLVVAMPLFIAVCMLLGWAVMGLAPAAALLLGAVLAPTDPVLASDVQVAGPGTGPSDPAQSDAAGTDAADTEDTDDAVAPAGSGGAGGVTTIPAVGAVEHGDGTGSDDAVDGVDGDVDEVDEARFALTSEAGLNDALAFPFVYAAIYLQLGGVDGGWLRWVGWDLVGKVAWGALIGWVCGALLARLAFRSRSSVMRLADAGEPLFALASIFAVYGLAEVLGGYGFLAVFTAAISGRQVERRHEYHGDLHVFTEQVEELLTLLILLLFGASLSWGLLADLTWAGAGVAVLLVLVVRPLTAVLGMWPRLPLGPSRLGARELRVVAFFGVRGIGSLYYVAYATGEAGFGQGREVWSTVAFTVLLSIVVHGVLATPVMGRLDRLRDLDRPAT